MNEQLTECYRVLGVKPGASSADLKAAHRDLTKVWHPDRFLHDLQLQQKAQEKLKEINDAYDLLSGKTKPRTPPPANEQRNATANAGSVRHIRWQLVVAPVLIFAATFFFASRSLLKTGRQVEENSIPAIRDTQDRVNPNEAQSTTAAKALPPNERVESKLDTDDSNGAISSVPNAALRPLPTVTVVVDSSTGMLARPWCPMKTSVTYPSGNEPRAFCSSHRESPVPPLEKTDGELRIKSAAKRVVSTIK